MKRRYPFKAAVLDTMLLIYLFEDTPAHAARCERIFEAVRRGDFRGIVTPITSPDPHT
jgi:predicted nucleic acid-binding protein